MCCHVTNLALFSIYLFDAVVLLREPVKGHQYYNAMLWNI